jgi:hypothetical protein
MGKVRQRPCFIVSDLSLSRHATPVHGGGALCHQWFSTRLVYPSRITGQRLAKGVCVYRECVHLTGRLTAGHILPDLKTVGSWRQTSLHDSRHTANKSCISQKDLTDKNWIQIPIVAPRPILVWSYTKVKTKHNKTSQIKSTNCLPNLPVPQHQYPPKKGTAKAHENRRIILKAPVS